MNAWHHLFISKNYKPALFWTCFRTFKIEVHYCLVPEIDFDFLNLHITGKCAIEKWMLSYLFFFLSYRICQCLICAIKCFVCACLITLGPENSLVLGTLLILKIETLHWDTASFWLVPFQSHWKLLEGIIHQHRKLICSFIDHIFPCVQ